MPPVDTLEHMGQQALQVNAFEKAAAYYEQLLEQQPDGFHYRLPLGLAYLLMGQEEAAQLTWAFAFSEFASLETNETDGESYLLEELIQLIQTKIQSLEQQEAWQLVDLLYLHLQGLRPLSVHQILQGIQAALKGELLSRERLENSGLLEALAETASSLEARDLEQLDTVLQKIVLWDDGEQGILDWIEAAAHPLPNRTAIAHSQPLETPAKLRVGFLSECMTKHSVGWLSRWIFQHFDRDRFEFYTYFQTCATQPTKLEDFSYEWFAKPATKACITYGEAEDIAQIIKEDNLNILVDLDSLTSQRNYSILALKPAPIQVTWLGYDSTGLPTVDYFLADRFVVPDHADDYYSEVIWRLPSTYIAVDGFEVDVPTLRRDQLNIPEDAIIYFSAQNAAKRHPDTVHCQIQILKQVPNSYLLLKGVGSEQSLRNSFLQAAAKEGIEGDRFRFLGPVKQEATHRANLGIADVVLDTFPYTGATTTLETLWMGIPIVTRVGNQFTSRNSYAMLRHAGVEAGLAHSADEYIEWGIRLGTDAALRSQVKHQLWRSRQTSPLWNTKQFTRDLEYAFEQMWQRYLQPSG